MYQQWQTSTSGITNKAAPIPISFSIPEGYNSTVKGGPILLDPYTVRFPMNPPLILPENCSCHLIQSSFSYSQPNIVFPNTIPNPIGGNNRITFKFGDAHPYIDVTIDNGLYSYIDVQTALNLYMRTHDVDGNEVTTGAIVEGATDLITLTGIASTQKILFILNPAALFGGVFPAGGLDVSFENPSPSGTGHTTDSMGPILGWPTSGTFCRFKAPDVATTDFSEMAPNVAGFSNTSAYVLYMSLCTNSYQNGSTGQLLYSFPLGSFTPNSVASFKPTLQFPVQISSGTFSFVDIWTTDQSGNRLPWTFYQAPFQFSALIVKNKADGTL